MAENFVHHAQEMLRIGKNLVASSPSLVKEVGTTNVKGDRTIEMDVAIEDALIDYIKKQNLPVNIFSEEKGTVQFHENPQFLVAFDPLDGSTNYKIGKGLLPFGLLVAFYQGLKPKLKDVVAAGAIEYTRDLAWLYDGQQTTDLNGKTIRLKTDWEIHRSTPIYLDLYYKEGYETYYPLAQQIFIRNTGSTIGNLSYTLSNAASGLGGVSMRAEEIGAVYALIKGVKGIAVNHQGQDLGEEVFSPEKTYPILAGNKTIVDFMVNTIKK